MDPVQHLFLVPLFMSCALAAPAPQFAYSTTTFAHPYVPLPFARAHLHDEFFNNHIDRSPQEAAPEPGRLPPSPYHFLPATLPQAIYSEPSHILSGYSYQTLDPAGAKSQVLFVSGPNSQQLFRQNADLLQIVLPALFTAEGDNAIPRPVVDSDTVSIPEQTGPANAPENAPAYPSEDGGSSSDETSEHREENGSAESRTEEENPAEKASEEGDKLTEISNTPEKSEDDSSKEESDKSLEEEGSTSSPLDKDDFKIDVSTSEASNSLKSVPPESDSLESASTDAPTTSATDTASDDKKSDENKSDEKKSDDKSSEEKTSEEKSSEGTPSDADQTTESTVTSTTVVPAE